MDNTQTDGDLTTAAKTAYNAPHLTVYGDMKEITRGANRNGNGAFNHIGKKGTPGSPHHGGFNHQYKHHGVAMSMYLGDPGCD